MVSQAARIIKLLISGSFSTKALAKIHRWLSSSSQSEEKDTALREVWKSTRPEASIESKRNFDALCHKLEIKTPTQVVRLNRRRVIASYAAVVALTVAVGAAYMIRNSAPEMITIAAANGKVAEYTLPDNTHVWLNSGTTITHPKKFGKKVRCINLDGEAYFKVEADESHPFEITTDYLKVVVVGTELDVNTYLDNGNVMVTLYSGKARVQVMPENGSKTKDGECYTLVPNQQLTFNTVSKKVVIEDKELSFPDFISGGLTFNNSSFDAIMKAIGRHFNVEIICDPAMIPQGHYSIKFVSGETLEETLSILNDFMQNFEYDIQGKKVVIKRQ